MRRQRLTAVAAVLALGLLAAGATQAQSQQVPLAGKAIPKFVDQLPSLDDLGVINATAGTGPLGTSQLVLNMTEVQAQVLPASVYAALPAPFNAGTYVWGYLPQGQGGRTTYLGPVILAERHNPVELKFVNNLGSTATTNVLAATSTEPTRRCTGPIRSTTRRTCGTTWPCRRLVDQLAKLVPAKLV